MTTSPAVRMLKAGRFCFPCAVGIRHPCRPTTAFAVRRNRCWTTPGSWSPERCGVVRRATPMCRGCEHTPAHCLSVARVWSSTRISSLIPAALRVSRSGQGDAQAFH